MEAYEDIASEQQQQWSEDDIMLLFMCCDKDCDGVVLVKDLINMLEGLNFQHEMVVDTIQALKSSKDEEITSEDFLKVVKGETFSFTNLEIKIKEFEQYYEKLVVEYENEIHELKSEHEKTLKSTISKYVSKTFELSELLETTKHERNLAFDECKKLKAELQETRKIKNSYKEEISSLIKEVEKRDVECRNALQTVSEVKGSLINYQVERKRNSLNFQNAKAEIYLLTSEVGRLNNQLEEEKRKGEREKVQDESQNMAEIIKQLKNKIEVIKEESAKELNHSIEIIQQVESEREVLLTWYEESQTELVNLKHEISILSTELEEERGKTQNNNTQNMVEIIEQLKNEVEFTKKESVKALNHSIEIIQQVESERKTLFICHQENQTELVNLKHEISILNTELEEERGKTQNTQNVAIIEQWKNEAEFFKVENARNNAMINELEGQVAFLKDKTEQSIHYCKEAFQLIDAVETERKKIVTHYQKSEAEIARLKIEIERVKFESEGEKNTNKIAEDLQKELGLLKKKTEVCVQSFNDSLRAFEKVESEREQLEAEIEHEKSQLNEAIELELLRTDVQNLELDRTLCEIAIEEKNDMLERLMNDLSDMHEVEEERRKKDQAESQLIEEIKFLKNKVKVASSKEETVREDTDSFKGVSNQPLLSQKEFSFYLSPYSNKWDLPAFFPMSPNE